MVINYRYYTSNYNSFSTITIIVDLIQFNLGLMYVGLLQYVNILLLLFFNSSGYNLKILRATSISTKFLLTVIVLYALCLFDFIF